MATYMLCHRHTAKECPVAFAAWSGFDSPLRHTATLGSCVTGGHSLWWEVEAADACAALSFLPPFVARRTEALPVRPVEIS